MAWPETPVSWKCLTSKDLEANYFSRHPILKCATAVGIYTRSGALRVTRWSARHYHLKVKGKVYISCPPPSCKSRGWEGGAMSVLKVTVWPCLLFPPGSEEFLKCFQFSRLDILGSARGGGDRMESVHFWGAPCTTSILWGKGSSKSIVPSHKCAEVQAGTGF